MLYSVILGWLLSVRVASLRMMSAEGDEDGAG